MNPHDTPPTYKVIFSPHFEEIIFKLDKKDKALLEKIQNQLIKLLRNPELGKPLRNVLRNRRRVHINPFVLVYEINRTEIEILDFDHHDKIYKKY